MHPELVGWGEQRGSIFLAAQKLPVQVPRVRDRTAGREVALATYQQFQAPRARDVGLFRRVLGGLSCREYEAAAETVPAAFGLATSSVSRRFIRASVRAAPAHGAPAPRSRVAGALARRQALRRRRHRDRARGDAHRRARILGMVQSATEHTSVCATLLRELIARGFRTPHGLLVIVDGEKGLRAAVRDVFGDDVAVQRCQWHEREHVLSYLPKREQPVWRRKLQAAYARASDADARRVLHRLIRELRVVNESAARSLEEGLDETLTLHRLGGCPELGRGVKTTTLIETVMARLEQNTQKVDRWRTSDQKLRWCAAALLAVEHQRRRVKGYAHLPLLERALMTKITPSTIAAA